MKRLFTLMAVATVLLITAAPAEAHRGHHHRHHHKAIHFDANGNPAGRLVTVATAAGIDITVRDDFAPRIKAFIADVVSSGYNPRRIHCYSLSHSHVRHSLHFSGEACDFNQHGWGKTDRFMYHVAAIAARHGLRDGCSFRDCGHIDSGRRAFAKTRPWPRVLAQAARVEIQ